MSTIVTFKAQEILHPVGYYVDRNYKSIKAMAQIIKKQYPEGSIALWCRGSSGLIIGGIICSILAKRDIIINHVKKDFEKTHEGPRIKSNCQTNIIVDDFTASGATVLTIKSEMIARGVRPDCLCVTGRVKLTLHEEFPLILCTKI